MSVQQIFPLPHLSDLLFAVFVFLIVVRSAGVVDIVPVLIDLCRSIFILLPLLATAALTFLTVGVPFIVGTSGGPVCKGSLWLRFWLGYRLLCRRRDRRYAFGGSRSRELACDSLGLGFGSCSSTGIRLLRSLGRLKS